MLMTPHGMVSSWAQATKPQMLKTDSSRRQPPRENAQGIAISWWMLMVISLDQGSSWWGENQEFQYFSRGVSGKSVHRDPFCNAATHPQSPFWIHPLSPSGETACQPLTILRAASWQQKSLSYFVPQSLLAQTASKPIPPTGSMHDLTSILKTPAAATLTMFDQQITIVMMVRNYS